MMRRIIAVVVIATMSLTSAPLFAAGDVRVGRATGHGQPTGTLTGTAKSSRGENLPNYTVRVRNLANGSLAGSTTTSAGGTFSFVLPPGQYAVELVGPAGEIFGTSASITLAAGATVNITITASAASALGAAAAGGAAGGAGAAAAPGFSTALIVTTVAVTAGIVGIVVAVNRSGASPSR
jgi:Carboxypeptidase regulatory-like domain